MQLRVALTGTEMEKLNQWPAIDEFSLGQPVTELRRTIYFDTCPYQRPPWFQSRLKTR